MTFLAGLMIGFALGCAAGAYESGRWWREFVAAYHAQLIADHKRDFDEMRKFRIIPQAKSDG